MITSPNTVHLIATALKNATSSANLGGHPDPALVISARTADLERNAEDVFRGRTVRVSFFIGDDLREVCEVSIRAHYAQPGGDNRLEAEVNWCACGDKPAAYAARFASVLQQAAALASTIETILEAAS